jgi:molybdopterin-containing oxidoreductase family membrane subunit
MVPNTLIPQLYWSKKMRTSIPVMFVVSIFVNIGMWFERFVIIVLSLNRDFLPSSWGYYRPTIIDVGTYMGTFGVFFTLFLLFMRWLPMVAMSEVKGTLPQADPHYGHRGDKHGEHHSEPVAAKGGLAAEGAE